MAPATKSSRRPTVLLVEPHDDTRQMYVEFLQHEGLEAVSVSNATDALPLAADASVIVTGIFLNGPVDGIELIRALRQNERTRQKPIVVLTACAWPADRERAIQAGCDAFLMKPCLPEDLEREIRTLVARTRFRHVHRKAIPGEIGPRKTRHTKRTA